MYPCWILKPKEVTLWNCYIQSISNTWNEFTHDVNSFSYLASESLDQNNIYSHLGYSHHEKCVKLNVNTPRHQKLFSTIFDSSQEMSFRYRNSLFRIFAYLFVVLVVLWFFKLVLIFQNVCLHSCAHRVQFAPRFRTRVDLCSQISLPTSNVYLFQIIHNLIAPFHIIISEVTNKNKSRQNTRSWNIVTFIGTNAWWDYVTSIAEIQPPLLHILHDIYGFLSILFISINCCVADSLHSNGKLSPVPVQKTGNIYLVCIPIVGFHILWVSITLYISITFGKHLIFLQVINCEGQRNLLADCNDAHWSYFWTCRFISTKRKRKKWITIAYVSVTIAAISHFTVIPVPSNYRDIRQFNWFARKPFSWGTCNWFTD